jgi:glutaredoxin 3
MKKIEVFSAGCSACQDVISLVQKVACSNCDVSILDMNKDDVAQRAKKLGIARVPAVVINGVLADCCQVKGISEESLREAGVGRP